MPAVVTFTIGSDTFAAAALGEFRMWVAVVPS